MPDPSYKEFDYNLTKPSGLFRAEVDKDEPGVEVRRSVDSKWMCLKVIGAHPEFGLLLSLEEALSVAKQIINNVQVQMGKQAAERDDTNEERSDGR